MSSDEVLHVGLANIVSGFRIKVSMVDHGTTSKRQCVRLTSANSALPTRFVSFIYLNAHSFEAKGRILFGPLQRNFDATAERLTSKIRRMATFGDGLNNRR